MSEQVIWRKGNELILDVPAPIDHADPSNLVVMDSAVATGYLFDQSVDLIMDANAAASQAIVVLEDVAGLSALDELVFIRDSGLFEQIGISSIVVATNTITLDANITTTGVTKGTKVYKVEGTQAAVSVTPHYGTSSLTETDWGYVVSFDHVYAPTVQIGDVLEAMIVVVKTATSSIYMRSWDVLVVSPKGP
jgi:hypothetical protein